MQYNLSNLQKLGTKDVYMSDSGLFPLFIFILFISKSILADRFSNQLMFSEASLACKEYDV